MKKLVKFSDDVYQIFDGKKEIAYISKNYLGSHGHYKGWVHYLFCEKRNGLVYAGVLKRVVYPGSFCEHTLDRWTEAPALFKSVKEFKDYYEVTK